MIFHSFHNRRSTDRCGALLLELVAAVALFSITLALAAPVISSVAAIRDQSQCRQLAGIALSNVMEQLAVQQRQRESVSAAAATITLDPATAELLDGAQLTVVTSDWDQIPRGVHVAARLTWTNGEGFPASPAELHAYFVDQSAAETQP